MRKFFVLIILIFLFEEGFTDTLDSTFRIFTENNLQGLKDEDGKIIIPALYDQLGWSDGRNDIIDGVIGYKKGNSWGLISVKNEKLSETVYTRIFPTDSDVIIAGKKEKFYNRNIYGIINGKNREIIPFRYYSISPAGSNYIVSLLKENELRYGLIDLKDIALIPVKYFSVISDHDFLFVENELNRIALFRNTGELLLDFDYLNITRSDSLFILNKDGKLGLYSKSGKTIIPPGMKEFDIHSATLLKTLEFPTWTILSAQNQIQDTLRFDHIFPFKDGYKVVANQYSMVLDEELIPIQKDTVHFSIRYDSIFKSGDLYFGGNRNIDLSYEWVIHSETGKKISDQSYEEIGQLREGLIPVKLNGFWGFIDKRGTLLFHGSYQEAESFRNGLSLVTYYNQKGLIDYEGKWKVLPSYATLEYVYDQTYIYKKGYSYGLVNGYEGVVYKTGNKLEEFNQMALETSHEGKYGLVDPRGKVLFETDYDTIVFSPQTDHFILEQEGRFKLYNIESGQVYPLKDNVQEVYQPSEGYFGIKANNKYGFVDTEGKLRISNRYDSIMPVKNGLIPIKLRGNWGIIDLSERILVQPLYQEADPVNTKNIIIRNQNGLGILDRGGKVTINASYDEILSLPNGHLKVTSNGKKGILDQNGNILAPPRYQDIQETANGYYIIERNSRYGLITNDGISTIPVIYEVLIYDPFRSQFLGKISSGWEVYK